ncbi:MAG: T9SS type A sorting domain-containing protein [Bacteroidota bacterium]
MCSIRFSIFFSLILLLRMSQCEAQSPSSRVYLNEEGFLEYTTDQEQNYIPNFSFAGYHNGDKALPSFAADLRINPIPGDNTSHIQAALDSLASLPLDSTGHRACLQLGPGVYRISGRIFMRVGGIVLKGSGSEDDSTTNTLLIGTGNTPSARSLINIGSLSSAGWDLLPGQIFSNLTSPYVPAGSRALQIDQIENFQSGDEVVIRHSSTNDWLASINFGDTGTDDNWSEGTINLLYQRTIETIDTAESKIVLNAPIFDHLETALAPTVIYPFTANPPEEIGIEDLQVIIASDDTLSEDHARNAVYFNGVKNSWARNVVAKNFTYAGIGTQSASKVSIIDCKALDPHSLITGGRRYNFSADARSNLILFQGCEASRGRHAFVSNGTSSTSGIVWTDCISRKDYSTSEGHRRWSQALLFDNIRFLNPIDASDRLIGLYNRGSFGTGHGWSSVHAVAWNVNIPLSNRIIIQKPPARQNYAIGCTGILTAAHTFNHPVGFIELGNQAILHPSLYDLQLQLRKDKGIAPDAPAWLEIMQEADSVQLSWMDVAALESGYQVERSMDGGNTYVEIATLAADATSYVEANMFPDSDSVYYRIAAFNNQGISPYSNRVKLDNTVSNEIEIEQNILNLYPNPTTQNLQLEYEGELKYSVLDMRGKYMLRKAWKKSINVSSWSPGIYLLRYHAKGSIGSIKFIKN